ncbi:MAG: Trm112 family protein [Gammaproteobacteria bacterium]|nr:Trm112 family protein [Gammaproteobacteria bacterium]
MIDQDLLRMLVCPKCNGPLEQVGDELICEQSQLAYPIQDGIPVLLVEEARELQSKA